MEINHESLDVFGADPSADIVEPIDQISAETDIVAESPILDVSYEERLKSELSELKDNGILPDRYAVKRNQDGNYLSEKEFNKQQQEARENAVSEIESQLKAHSSAAEGQTWKQGIAEYNQRIADRREATSREEQKVRLNHGAKVADLFRPEINAAIQTKIDKELPLVNPLNGTNTGKYYAIKPSDSRRKAEARTSELGHLYKEFDRQILLAAVARDIITKGIYSDKTEAKEADPILIEPEHQEDPINEQSINIEEAHVEPETHYQEPEVGTIDNHSTYEDFKTYLGIEDSSDRTVQMNHTPLTTIEVNLDQDTEVVDEDEPGESRSEYEDYKRLLGIDSSVDESMQEDVPTASEISNDESVSTDTPHVSEEEKPKKFSIRHPKGIKDAVKDRVLALKARVSVKDFGKSTGKSAKDHALKAQLSATGFSKTASKAVYNKVAGKLGRHSWEDLNENQQQRRRHVAIAVGAVTAAATIYGIVSGDSSHHEAVHHVTNHLLAKSSNKNVHGENIKFQLTNKSIPVTPPATSEALTGVDLSTASPWTVAHAVNPSNVNATLNEAASKFQQLYGTHYVLTPDNGTVMFMNGPSVISPHDQYLMNEILAQL